jgi:hypothetical protein
MVSPVLRCKMLFADSHMFSTEIDNLAQLRKCGAVVKLRRTLEELRQSRSSSGGHCREWVWHKQRRFNRVQLQVRDPDLSSFIYQLHSNQHPA